MKKIKRLIFVTAVIGLISLLIIGCSAPTETEAPKSEPSKGETPKAEAPTAPSKTEILIAAGRTGDSWYVLSHALATFINKDSQRLTASVFTTGGITDNSRLLVEQQESRKNTIIVRVDGDEITVPAKVGGSRFEPKVISPLYVGPSTPWVTFDKNIKTVKDFSGKRVGCVRKASCYWPFQEEILKREGVLDKVRSITNGGYDANLTALRDGAIDVATIRFDFVPPNTYTKGAFLEQLAGRGDLYMVNINEEAIKGTCEKFGLPPVSLSVPAGFPSSSSSASRAPVELGFWQADASMSEDIVYEIAKIIWSHANDFKEYHALGAGITQDFLSMSAWGVDSEGLARYHPGALKFYKDNGVQIKPMKW